MTWESVEETLRRTHAATPCEHGVELRRADEMLVVRPVEVEGKPWVEVAITIAPRAKVNLAMGMLHNFELPIGALVVSGDNVLLAQTLPLDGLDLANLDEVMEFLASKSAELRATVVVGATDTDDYANTF